MIYFQMVRFRKEKMTMSTNGANRTQIPREGQLLQIWTGTGYWDTRGSYSTVPPCNKKSHQILNF